MVEQLNPELESFRNQWRQEVESQRTTGAPNSIASKVPVSSGPSSQPPKYTHNISTRYDYDEGWQTQVYNDVDGKEKEKTAGSTTDGAAKPKKKEPQTALEHYEEAVKRESQGKLGDSLKFYRKAFRLDDQVDVKYRKKHFPPGAPPCKPGTLNPSNASATVPNTAHHSLTGSLSDIIASFANLRIEPKLPEIANTPSPSCPISSIPTEILIDVLEQLAVIDVASFVRLAQVCKHFAYLVATENRIWKRVCLGREFGFGGMHYKWACNISGEHYYTFDSLEQSSVSSSPSDSGTSTPSSGTLSSSEISVPSKSHHPSVWLQMFRMRPRLRFNGCYISTVNYTRPGASSPTQVSWNTPVHIVTYYRYLRFFRDGRCISLLTTLEPIDVVSSLTTSALCSTIPASSPISHALRGRWRLSTPEEEEGEGDVHIETEGVDPKYIYKMHLALRSAGKGTRNNKMIWKGFWSYNQLTDDWAEFGLRNDRAFFWSRVKSYGLGE